MTITIIIIIIIIIIIKRQFIKRINMTRVTIREPYNVLKRRVIQRWVDCMHYFYTIFVAI